jgi:hypothetical protein
VCLGRKGVYCLTSSVGVAAVSNEIPASVGRSSCQWRCAQVQSARHWSDFFSSFVEYAVAFVVRVSRFSAPKT